CAAACESLGLGLYTDRQSLEKYIINDFRDTGRVLFYTDQLLKEAKLSIKSIHGMGVCIGPGNFTSLRVLLSLFKTIAYAGNISLYGYNTLDILAASVLSFNKAVVLPAVNAYRQSLYCACFYNGRCLGNYLDLKIEKLTAFLQNPEAADPFAMQDKLPDKNNKIIVCGNGVQHLPDVNNNNVIIVRDRYQSPDPARIYNRVAGDISNNIVPPDLFNLKPFYIRDSV
ncbi:MAG TPA: tRNA (adenosine(37)-N6)-threonylcarbamoyltransferase complex dimerization subunit type 1 TsaB, partial [Spirochaetota bacterium]|nr:tRNA (adenosine(37)-N6)-threonylcarbamoyltransferase complex dimerization subunit type 1 TsaB [Spirochaetota bacterium]